LERRFAQVEATQQKGFFGRILQQQIDDSKVGNVGSKAVPFTQNDTAGNPISLSSFRGKYVLIDFWASWCRPCRMENPNVVNAYQRFKNKNFTVLGVSLDRSRPDWLRAISDDRLTWTHVSDLKFWGNEVAQRYRVQSIPQNFLISPEGIVVAKNLRGGELINRLCAILGCE
ncbi:MAG: peroxiredoxin family protein, partial [Chitinophagaceae bacterium]